MRIAIFKKENLKHNLEVIKDQYKNIDITGVVKANAYGHGAKMISKWLYEFGIKDIAVATLDEAKDVLKNNLKQNILILGPSDKNELKKINDERIIQTVFSKEYYNLIKNIKIKKQINVNTGMNRLGINYGDQIINSIKDDFLVKGLYTHFLNNKDYDTTKNQLSAFYSIKHNLKSHTSIADVKLLKEHSVNNIRVGLTLYGYEDFEWSDRLKPVMSLFGKIISVQDVKKGNSISYNARFIAEKDMKVATVSIGYADGIPWNYKKGYVYYKDKKCKILGQITMDYIMIDVTDIDCDINDYVEIFGDNISLKDVAQKSDTIVYEILTKIGKRVNRRYI